MSADVYRVADVTIDELEARKKLIDAETDRAKAREWNAGLLEDIKRLRALIDAGKHSGSSQKRASFRLIEIICGQSLADMQVDAQRRLALLEASEP